MVRVFEDVEQELIWESMEGRKLMNLGFLHSSIPSRNSSDRSSSVLSQTPLLPGAFHVRHLVLYDRSNGDREDFVAERLAPKRGLKEEMRLFEEDFFE
ncbi:hypothetical protein PMIN06_010600 [Paraphaeosphaeria minitans]